MLEESCKYKVTVDFYIESEDDVEAELFIKRFIQTGKLNSHYNPDFDITNIELAELDFD